MITEKEVRLVDDSGEHVGVVPISEALARSEQAGLDLVEIADKATPHVCRIMDYGHYKFEQAKKQKEAKKKQKQISVKEMTLRPRTEEHDYQFKIRHVRDFLEAGNKVRVSIVYKGREMAHKEVGAKQLERMTEDLSDIATAEQRPSFEGRRLVAVYAPIPGKTGGKRAKAEDEAGSGQEVRSDEKREDQAQQGEQKPHSDEEKSQTETPASSR